MEDQPRGSGKGIHLGEEAPATCSLKTWATECTANPADRYRHWDRALLPYPLSSFMQCVGRPDDFPGGASDKEYICQCRRYETQVPGKIPWRKKWQPTTVFLRGEFHGQRSLVSYSPWNHKESDTTEWLNFAVQKLLILIRSHLFTFVFIPITPGGGS